MYLIIVFGRDMGRTYHYAMSGLWVWPNHMHITTFGFQYVLIHNHYKIFLAGVRLSVSGHLTGLLISDVSYQQMNDNPGA